ncbi:MFS transporter [Actinophytocola xinjiangensis]|uniref:MFS transporter n=1 Tax=Actinophytocola xinjiangensis TaxID=485602 RepID=A0A7Z0WRU4_9PSEU|nr:MFS transporter [Actinophytocola xinjiangensis]OLF14115.1 MFS transporter [Actinophytocola xinjiangensis]
MRPVNALIATHGLSSFGLGLVFPYTAIYLADQPAVGTTGVAMFYACTGGANVVVALLLSAHVIRLPKVTLGVLGTVLWFAGYLLLPAAAAPPVVALAALMIGAGQGCFMAAIIPLVNALVTAQERRSVFARRYAVLNVTLALGSLAAGVLTLVLPRTVIPWFFVANAVGILPMTLAIVVAGRHLPPEEDDKDTGEGGKSGGTLPALGLWKLAMPAAAFQLAVYLFGYSQFEATAPLVTEKLMGMELVTISIMLVLNVLVIVVGQRPITRLLEKHPETTGLRWTVIAWVTGFLVAGVCAFGPTEVKFAGLLVYAALFALGECAYSCSFHPWLISMVPDHELTRANALVNSMMGIGNFTGPSIGVALVLTGDTSVVWFGLAASCTAVMVLVGLLARRRPAATATLPA